MIRIRSAQTIRPGAIASCDTPAKINLFLEIMGRRSDGYHDLESLMVPIPWYDSISLTVQSAGNDELDIDIPEPVGSLAASPLEPEPDNLILRALKLLRASYDLPPFRIQLTKRIPVGAGLGGGSGNAAGILALVNDWFQLGLTDETLLSYAAELGSDVPFFLLDGPAIARGRGEQLTRWSDSLFGNQTLYIVLLFHEQMCSTPSVFQGLSFPLTSPDGPISFDFALFAQQDGFQRCFNRLQMPALEALPQLESTAAWLGRSILSVQVTPSNSKQVDSKKVDLKRADSNKNDSNKCESTEYNLAPAEEAERSKGNGSGQHTNQSRVRRISRNTGQPVKAGDESPRLELECTGFGTQDSPPKDTGLSREGASYGRRWAMTGSGSTFFVLTPVREEAEVIARRAKSELGQDTRVIAYPGS